MKRIYVTIATIWMALVGTLAQERPLAAIYTDKESYLAGEALWIKVCMNPDEASSLLSKVAYVEVSDSRQMHAQGKIALTDGTGWGCIRMPQTMHSGVYRLTVYTRYMRNYQPDCFPTKHIAVLNARNTVEGDALVKDTLLPAPTEVKEAIAMNDGTLTTDKTRYGKREKVVLRGINQWNDAKELTLSVVRQDMSVRLPEEITPQPKKPAGNGHFVVESEGHIVSGRPTATPPEHPTASLACVGKKVHLFEGQRQADGTYAFYTHGVKGQRDIVLSITGEGEGSCSLEPVSPFVGVLPDTLPPLYYRYDEQAMTERSIAAQIIPLTVTETPFSQEISEILLTTPPHSTYNVTEYARFATLNEALVEYVMGVRTERLGGQRVIKVMQEESNMFSLFKALVLLDGVPVDNHEAVLGYAPRHINYIHQYRGRYTFGGKLYDGILSIVTLRGTFPELQVDANARMFSYEFPQERPAFSLPQYDTEEQLASRMPDFRHTLYWQPEVAPDTQEISFYTSDLPGIYLVTLQGVTKEGKAIRSCHSFEVK